jgi:tetratricopeptide (TPR) repeat protein
VAGRWAVTTGGARQAFVVRVATRQDAAAPAAGVGVVVDDGRVLTCAHVVNVALGRPKHETREPPDEARVLVELPLLDGSAGPGAACQIAAWLPPSNGRPGGGDVAALVVVSGALAGDAQPACFTAAEACQGESVDVFGYPSDPPRKESGGWATCTVRGAVGGGAVQLDSQPGSALRPQPGYSGSPVVRRERDADTVVGLLVVASRHDGTKDSYAIPVSVLEQAWPGLSVRVAAPSSAAEDGAEDARVSGDRVSASVDCWRDREEARAQLCRLLLAGQRITAVTGRRGIGKSALVARVLSDFERADPDRHREEDLDALAYLSTRTGSGALTLARVYETLTCLAPASDQQRLRRRWDNIGRDALPGLWEALRRRRVVVVLDNLDDLQDPESGVLDDEETRDFLASACRTPWPPRVVTTSVRPLVLPSELRPHVASLELVDGLPDADAVAVLRALDSYGVAGLDELDDEELVAAARRVHGVPRGLELLAQLLEDDPYALEQVLASPAAPEELLSQLVAASYTLLTGPERAVVGVVALAGVPLPAAELPEILRGVVEEAQVRAAVHRLHRNRELGLDRQSGLLRLHPLDADYVTDVGAAGDGELHLVLSRRLGDWYAARRTPPDSWRLLADAAPNTLEFRHRLRAGERDAAIAALAEAAEFLARRGEARLLLQAVADIEPSLTSPIGRVHLELCRAHAELFDGSLERAESALRAARDAAAAGPTELLPSIDTWLATVLRHRGHAAEAVPLLLAAGLDDPGASRDDRTKGLFELAMSLCYLGDVAGAGAAVERLAAAVGTDGPPSAQAGLADARALIALLRGDRQVALAAAAEAVAALALSPNWDDAGYVQNLRGVVLLDLDDLAAAERELELALEGALDTGLSRLVGFAATNCSWLRLRQGRVDEAVDAAQLGAERLGDNSVDEAASPRALAALLRTGTIDLAALTVVSRLTLGNPDLYRPSEAVLAELVGTD